MKLVKDFALELIKEARLAGRYGTASLYASTLNSFLKFWKDDTVTFKEVTAGTIKQYEEFLLQEGLRRNTISAYMRMLRSIFNQAREQNIPDIEPTNLLFRYVFTGYESTKKRAIPATLLRRLVDLDLKEQLHLRFSRDLFLLSFYLRGIPFVDLINLRKTDVDKKQLNYYRQKTRKEMSIYIEPQAEAIFQRYSTKKSPTPYLLPILSDTGDDRYRQYKSALRLYNQHLHTISEILHLEVPLTSYVARHSWATTAKNEGVSTPIICEGMGHSSEKITRIYLASFSDNVMSKVNKKVISTIHPKKKKKKTKKNI